MIFKFHFCKLIIIDKLLYNSVTEKVDLES
jgi:hypothetical protein